ncbi:unnamed protein product [Hydatigera taeniaeformis]|uniref:Uncharacterized protein n=1 Tax=Hydatigena taeniaeformis TaxID=6205 RepID=A0A0R3XCS4_HYDTA|nr:unnamed protein product [Hydatigera taeniaeformis]
MCQFVIPKAYLDNPPSLSTTCITTRRLHACNGLHFFSFNRFSFQLHLTLISSSYPTSPSSTDSSSPPPSSSPSPSHTASPHIVHFVGVTFFLSDTHSSS